VELSCSPIQNGQEPFLEAHGIRELTFENLSEGTTAKFFDDLETTLQDLLILLQHIVFFFAKIGVGASDKLVSSV